MQKAAHFTREKMQKHKKIQAYRPIRESTHTIATDIAFSTPLEKSALLLLFWPILSSLPYFRAGESYFKPLQIRNKAEHESNVCPVIIQTFHPNMRFFPTRQAMSSNIL